MVRTSIWMTPACSRMRTSLRTARTVLRIAIIVVGETIPTLARRAFSTTSGKFA